MHGLHVVIFGNPVDGFQYVGPFPTGDDAGRWAERADLGADWWLAPLQAKEVVAAVLIAAEG